MAKYFDEVKWSELVEHEDAWYLKLNPELEALKAKAEAVDEEEAWAVKAEVRDFFEQKLEAGEVRLADSGPDLDVQRQPIDTVVIHHTSAQPGYSLSRMNAVQLVNIYVPYFCAPSIQGEEGLRGHLMWSNHFHGNKQVFYVYHWLLRMDGTAERLLDDNQIGWHAGNWNVNCRSVGVALDNDYENTSPAEGVLDQLAELIRQNYPQVRPERILGHREVNQKSISPGNQFLSGWKDQLVSRLKG